MRRYVKQIPNANAKESTETNLLRPQYRPLEEGLIGGKKDGKKSFFLRVTGSGKMCEMLLTISFNFKLISANCLAVNAASRGLRTDSSKSPPVPIAIAISGDRHWDLYSFVTAIRICTPDLPATGSCTITATATAIQLSNFRIFKIHSKRYATASRAQAEAEALSSY